MIPGDENGCAGSAGRWQEKGTQNPSVNAVTDTKQTRGLFVWQAGDQHNKSLFFLLQLRILKGGFRENLGGLFLQSWFLSSWQMSYPYRGVVDWPQMF